jgi:hypothetical protein
MNIFVTNHDKHVIPRREDAEGPRKCAFSYATYSAFTPSLSKCTPVMLNEAKRHSNIPVFLRDPSLRSG